MIFLNTKLKWLLVCAAFCICEAVGVPLNPENSLVVNSRVVRSADKELDKEGTGEAAPQSTHIYQMQVTSQIANRFVHTTVLSKVKNYAKKAEEVTFSIVLPDTAFISGFIMEIDGKNYTAYVKEKEEAKKTYEQAVASGQSAAHVAVSARDSNRFTVSVNIEPESKAAFYLNYEELLKRQENQYELVINLHPGQPVKDLSVKVTINESRKLVNLKVPPLRSGNEIGSDKPELDPRATITIIDEKNAVVTFSPNVETQKQLASILGTKEENGLAGQFVVQYDVERDPQGGEVIIHEGYFAHFFAPSDLHALLKHVVFVLDTSGSMGGQKIVQLRESMVNILDQLNKEDTFQLVEFNSIVRVLNIDNPEKNVKYPNHPVYGFADDGTYPPLASIEFEPPYVANANNIEKAKAAARKLTPMGSTDIYTGLEIGLYLVELAKKNNSTHQPIIIFLTDGSPNVRISSTEQIITKITEFNSGTRKSAIFTLAFGNYANKDFLQKLASRNNGFSRQIYEAADASIQLQNFYKQISSPLLADVIFKYEPSTTSLTVTEFPIHFGGSELVVAGCYSTPEFMPPIIEGRGRVGKIVLKPKVQRSVSSVERLWAYLTVKQLLEKKETSEKDGDALKKKALDVALKYQFVTSVSSLVVVKPNATSAVDTEAADKHALPQFTSTHALKISSFPLAPSAGSSAVPFYDHQFNIIGGATFDSMPELSHRVPAPTARPRPAVTKPPSPSKKDIFSALPWLKEILVNGVLSLSKGNYKLGLNETITDKVTCTNGLENRTGNCTLIHACNKAYTLPSREVYEQHFCILKNEYAGVCCPTDD